MKERSQAPQGFISTVFLIVMCVMMSLIAAKADYIIKADLVFANLEKCEEDFETEAFVIDAFKCMLARKEEIGNFETHGIYVSVYWKKDGYELHYLDCRMSVIVYEDMIVDFYLYRQ